MAHHRVIATTVMQQRSWRRGRQAITAAAAAIAIAGAGADGRIANCPPSGTRCGGNGALHLVTRHRHGSWCRGVACQCRGLGVPSQAFDGLQGILGSSLNSSRCHHVRVLHVQAAAAEHEHRQHGVPHYPHGVPAEREGDGFILGRGRAPVVALVTAEIYVSHSGRSIAIGSDPRISNHAGPLRFHDWLPLRLSGHRSPARERAHGCGEQTVPVVARLNSWSALPAARCAGRRKSRSSSSSRTLIITVS